ncbi:MAG TPA: PAS domain S-box protein, partial [bacterium]
MLADRRVGSVRVAVSNAVIAEAKRQAIWEGLIVGTLEIAVSVIALGLIALFLTRNLARLHAAAGAIAGGNPSVRAQVSGEDEVAQAARAFNQMLDSLQEARLLATQSETQYRNLVEHSQQAILVLEGERPVFANPACARLLGYPGPEPVLALATIADRVAPAGRERLRAAMATGAGDARHHELEIVTADGRTRWLDCLPSAVQWRGRPALQLAMSDIGERKQAQLGLQESEGYFRTVAEAAPSALYVVERDSGRLRFANARVAEMFGFADSPLNHLMEEFYWDPSERPAVLRRIAAAGRVTDLQLRFRRRGEPFWGLVSSFAGTFQGVPALFSSVQDITERVHAEQALAASEGRYRSLVELIPEAILVHSEGVIRYANHTAVQTLGAQDASQLVGTRVLDCVHPEYRTRVQARIGRLAGGTGTVPMVQERLLRIDGAEFDAEVTAMGLAFEEQPSVLVVFRDITERLQAERALREAQQRLHTVIQYAPLILYVLDAQGRFLISEGRELAAVGRVPGEVVGQSAFDVFAHLPERVRTLERALAGEALTEEVIVDGVHFDAYHQPLFDAQGAVSGLIVVSVNTTSRRQAEDALRASEARFRDFAHASSDWLWETDAEHRLSYLSDEFERITGERRENYIGKRREELAGDMDDADKWGEYRRLI